MSKYAIETVDLTKVFPIREKKSSGFEGFVNSYFRKTGKIVAVDHVNLKVKTGELFGLLGPNGAGKTTAVKMLSTLLWPTEGTAIVNGFDVKKQESDVKSSIGLIFGRERQLYWRTPARFNLEFYAAMYGLGPDQARERIDYLLDLVGLSDRQHDYVMHYSTGMKQKLAIARGLLTDAPILLMDEPTQGLDPRAARDTRRLIKQELNRKNGKTVFLTTHIMYEAEKLCDRTAIVDKGKIVVVDTPENLKKRVEEESSVQAREVTMEDVFIHFTGGEWE